MLFRAESRSSPCLLWPAARQHRVLAAAVPAMRTASTLPSGGRLPRLRIKSAIRGETIRRFLKRDVDRPIDVLRNRWDQARSRSGSSVQIICQSCHSPADWGCQNGRRPDRS